MLQTVEARSRDRLRSLETTLETRKQQEIENITSVLDELEHAIRQELAKAVKPEQLALKFPDYTDEERLQVRRDTEALKLQLARIPDEKEQEIRAIRLRYEGFAVRTFPIAVIFVVPDLHPWRAEA